MEVRFVDVKSGKSLGTQRLPCVVGRGDDAAFRLKNDSVSRHHCEFTVANGVVLVTDLGSTNGTTVAEKKLEAQVATPVPSGAKVRIGGIVLRIDYTAPKVAKREAKAVASRGDDTVPLLAAAAAEAAEIPELEPVVDQLPELEPVAPAAPEAVAAEPGSAPPADSAPSAPVAAAAAFPEVDAAPEPAAGSFEFLGGAEPPAEADDDNLNDFFKSLS